MPKPHRAEKAASKFPKRRAEPKPTGKGKGKAAAVAADSGDEDQNLQVGSTDDGDDEVKKPARGQHTAKPKADIYDEIPSGPKRRKKQSPAASDEEVERPAASQTKRRKAKGCVTTRASLEDCLMTLQPSKT